jgi:hypothetical protein
MSDLIPQIGLAIEAYKGRQQDIIGLGHRAYKDLFTHANAAMLTWVVKDQILRAYAEMVNPHAPRTSLLAAVSQQHGEIIAGCRVLTQDEGILSALTDAANGATTEALQLIYAEKPETSSPATTAPRVRKSGSTSASSPAKKRASRAKKSAQPKSDE